MLAPGLQDCGVNCSTAVESERLTEGGHVARRRSGLNCSCERTQGDDARPGQGGEVEDCPDIIEVLLGVGNGVRQHQPAFGVGVVDVDREPLVGSHNVVLPPPNSSEQSGLTQIGFPTHKH